jgi:hypothetical protein
LALGLLRVELIRILLRHPQVEITALDAKNRIAPGE